MKSEKPAGVVSSEGIFSAYALVVKLLGSIISLCRLGWTAVTPPTLFFSLSLLLPSSSPIFFPGEEENLFHPSFLPFFPLNVEINLSSKRLACREAAICATTTVMIVDFSRFSQPPVCRCRLVCLETLRSKLLNGGLRRLLNSRYASCLRSLQGMGVVLRK